MLPIGGPGPAYSAKEQADLLFKLTGLPPKYFPVPVALMDGVIGILDFFARFFPDKFEVGGWVGWVGLRGGCLEEAERGGLRWAQAAPSARALGRLLGCAAPPARRVWCSSSARRWAGQELAAPDSPPLPAPPSPCHTSAQDAAEFGRIGKYYAVESMLVWDPVKQVYLADETPEYGKVGWGLLLLLLLQGRAGGWAGAGGVGHAAGCWGTSAGAG
jgi:hypothetical protein